MGTQKLSSDNLQAKGTFKLSSIPGLASWRPKKKTVLLRRFPHWVLAQCRLKAAWRVAMTCGWNELEACGGGSQRPC